MPPSRTNGGSFDMQAMLAAFSQMQQQQQAGQLQGQQNYFDNTNPLGVTGMANARPGGLTPGSQWSAMFGDNAASAMTPEARMASQGGSAINQWAQAGGVPGVDPAGLQAQMLNQTRLPGVAGIESVDQFSDKTFMPRINQQFGFTPRTDLPGQVPTQALQMPQASGKPKRKGSSFGMQASGSPSPGYRF